MVWMLVLFVWEVDLDYCDDSSLLVVCVSWWFLSVSLRLVYLRLRLVTWLMGYLVEKIVVVELGGYLYIPEEELLGII
jgi:hypothetical protein